MLVKICNGFLVVLCVLSFSACVTTPESGRQAFIITSENEESQMGLQAYSEVLKKEKVSSNARWNEIVQRVGARIAKSANKPEYQWEFKLLESKEQNAFCLPGGKVAIYTGILSVCQNEAALAAVMGHEVAHATARHGGQRMTVALGTQIGLVGFSAILGQNQSTEKNLLLAALGVGSQVGVMLPFSRSNESEADEIGLTYMARAGYDPKEAPRFWDRFSEVTKGSPPEFLSTHPASQNRKAALEAQVSKANAIYAGSPKYGIGETF